MSVYATQKIERPLKYETTRPVSAKLVTRVQSAKDHRTGKDLSKIDDNTSKDQAPNVLTTDNDSDMLDNPLCSDKKYPGMVAVDPVTKKADSDSVNAFVEDMKNMNLMEDEFKKSTFQLQKKLGIPTRGLIY